MSCGDPDVLWWCMCFLLLISPIKPLVESDVPRTVAAATGEVIAALPALPWTSGP